MSQMQGIQLDAPRIPVTQVSNTGPVALQATAALKTAAVHPIASQTLQPAIIPLPGSELQKARRA